MLDFCLGLRNDFSVGILPWSESGRDHFADVRTLFQLDLVLLILSAAALLVLFWYPEGEGWFRPGCWGGGPVFGRRWDWPQYFWELGPWLLPISAGPLCCFTPCFPRQDQLDL